MNRVKVSEIEPVKKCGVQKVAELVGYPVVDANTRLIPDGHKGIGASQIYGQTVGHLEPETQESLEIKTFEGMLILWRKLSVVIVFSTTDKIACRHTCQDRSLFAGMYPQVNRKVNIIQPHDV